MYKWRKILEVRAAIYCFRKNSIIWAFFAALTKLSSAPSLVYKKIPRSLLVETFGIVRVLGGLGGGTV